MHYEPYQQKADTHHGINFRLGNGGYVGVADGATGGAGAPSNGNALNLGGHQPPTGITRAAICAKQVKRVFREA